MEQAVIFGMHQNLVGIVNIADKSNSSISRTAMILVTPGMLHSAGPFRMYKDIADQNSQQGISSLRFDLSGIGESLGVGATGKSIDRAVKEISQAMDFLSKEYGFEQFILFGFCSGTDDSVQTALMDERVKGVIALDGLYYKTPRYWFHHSLMIIRKMFVWQKWWLKLQKSGEKLTPVSLANGEDIREFPEMSSQAVNEFQQLVDRGTQLHFIYTGGMDGYNYAQQFYEMLPNVKWKGTESTQFFPHSDHVGILCEDRDEIVADITQTSLKMINA
ncbi:MAG TPA: lipase [Leucothrix sp.]|nr:lipase [Leucothrix sp.]